MLVATDEDGPIHIIKYEMRVLRSIAYHSWTPGYILAGKLPLLVFSMKAKDEP